MKYVVSFLLVVLLSSTAFADLGALIAEKEQLEARTGELETQWINNEAEGERLAQRKSDLEWSATQVQKQIEDWNAASASLTSRIETHNSQCGGTYEDEAHVDQCNSNANALNSEGNYLKELSVQIDELVSNQQEQEQIVDNEITQYQATADSIKNEFSSIQARLAEIGSFVGDCESAISEYDASSSPETDGTMERMKAECGSMFDGN